MDFIILAGLLIVCFYAEFTTWCVSKKAKTANDMRFLEEDKKILKFLYCATIIYNLALIIFFLFMKLWADAILAFALLVIICAYIYFTFDSCKSEGKVKIVDFFAKGLCIFGMTLIILAEVL